MGPQISQTAAMRRETSRLRDRCRTASGSRLWSRIATRRAKAVWRAEIILATADGLGTNAIMRLTGKSKPCVWRWQERYRRRASTGLMRDKTRPPGKKPLSAEIKRKVLT